MARDVVDAEIVESRDDLVAWLEAGCKPAEAFRIGAEHEKFPFYKSRSDAGSLRGPARRPRAARGHARRLGWEPIEDAGKLIGLLDASGGAAISLEPGGQFELSGAPLTTVHEIAAELDAHLRCAHAVADSLGIGFLALGVSPKWSFAETPVDAQEPLPHHVALHAESRDARARHDVSHRDGADQFRFFRRGRHGRQAARRSRAAACRHRAVRQFAVHRGRA